MACSDPQTVTGQHGNTLRSCGQCLNCRIKEQSSLTFRLLLENQIASSSWFLTLTYEEAPEIGDYRDFEMFLDRLRVRNRRAGSNYGSIRYLAIGEYGDRYGRFHWHAIMMNSLPFDPEVWRTSLWPHGFYEIGEVNQASIRYTCRYTTKFLAKYEPKLPRGRSQRPPLGATCMKSLATDALEAGWTTKDIPTTIKWDGRTWPVDNAMRIAWAEVISPHLVERDARGTRKLVRSGAIDTLDYEITKRFGDPYQDMRAHQERRWQRKHDEMELRHKL